jgi:hypothetical protein
VQNRLTDAKTGYLDALIDYKMAVIDLKKKTMWDFEENRPVIRRD